MIAGFESMLRPASWMLGAGLVVQLATCFWNDAVSFLVFATLGTMFTAGGTLLFLRWLVAGGRGAGHGIVEERP